MNPLNLVGSLGCQVYGVSLIAVTGDPAQGMTLVLTMLGAGCLLLDLRAVVLSVVVALLGWGVVASGMSPPPAAHWIIDLVACALLAVIVAIARIRSLDALEASELSHRLVVETSLDAVITIDPAGRIVGWNRRAEQTFGWRAEEVRGLLLADTIIPREMREAHRAGLRRAVETGTGSLLRRRFETRALRRDGEEFPVELSITPIGSGEQTQFTAFLRDITSRRRAEEGLREAKEAAEAAARAKSEFLATMSHEIRTPLNGVFGMTELALDSEDDEERRDFLNRARACAGSLMSILNDVLDFSKIEAGHLELESIDFDPRQLLDGVVDTLAIEAERKGLEFVCSVEETVPSRLRGDPGRLRQILINLGSNALKFTEKGEVVIRLGGETYAGPGDSDARFLLRATVRDTGIGIPPERRAEIFQAFTQADSSTTRRFGGTGLGLAIAQRLVAGMGGAIGVEGNVGEGSTFWFTAAVDAVAPPPPRPVLPPGGRVLVVDDHPASRAHLAETIRSWGLHVDTVADGLAACSLIGNAARDGAPFSLVILDLAMPDPDGATTARWIRSAPWGADLAIVALGSSVSRRSSLPEELGFAAVVGKPVKPTPLLTAIRAALGPRAAARRGESRSTGSR